MATPIWNEKKQQWRLRCTVDGVTKEFTSSKSGLAGKKAVLAKSRAYFEGSLIGENALVSVIWEKFLSDVEARRGAHSDALQTHKKIGSLYILPAIGSKKIGKVTKQDLQTILNEAKPHNNRCDVLSKKYLTTIRASIVAFMQFSYENNYCEALRGQLYIPANRPVIGKEILQPSQIRRLFEPSDLHYHKAICFMCATGLRPSECLGLKWEDIEGSYIHINRGVRQNGRISIGKTSNSRRTIPLNAILRKLLDEQREATKALKSEWIFCDAIGDYGKQSTLQKHYYKLKSERNLAGSPYSLRHTFISMIKNDMPEQMVKSIVGHSAAMDTFGVYGHIVDGELKQAGELIDLTFKKVTENKADILK